MYLAQVHVDSSSLKPKDTANGTQYQIDIQLTVELVGDLSRLMIGTVAV